MAEIQHLELGFEPITGQSRIVNNHRVFRYTGNGSWRLEVDQSSLAFTEDEMLALTGPRPAKCVLEV